MWVLLRHRPLEGENVKLRCCLVLQIALADLLFGALTLSASAAILLGLPSSGTTFCKVGLTVVYPAFMYLVSGRLSVRH